MAGPQKSINSNHLFYNITRASEMTKRLAKVIKKGNDHAINLYKTVLTKAGFEIGDEMKYQVRDGEIRFTEKEEKLKDDIQNFYKNGGRYQEEEIDFGEPVGKESW